MDGLKAAAANGLGQCINRSSEGFRFTLLCNRPEPTRCLDSARHAFNCVSLCHFVAASSHFHNLPSLRVVSDTDTFNLALRHQSFMTVN